MIKTESIDLLTAIEYAYRLGRREEQQHIDTDAATRAEEIIEWLFDDGEEEEAGDDVDETNYDPFAGGELFEADYNLGEAEEW